MAKIKVGDKVKLILGKDRGKSGKVIQVFPKENKVVVEGLNKLKKHMRANRRGEKGQVIELSGPVHLSNVMLICPKCGKESRIGYQRDGKQKDRVCKKCKEVID